MFYLSCVSDPMDNSLPGFSVPGISQATILQWVAISFSRGSSLPRDQTHVSCISCIGRQILYHWATWESPYEYSINIYCILIFCFYYIFKNLGNSVIDHGNTVFIASDQISHSVVSDSLRPHGSQHARPPCPSPTPGVHSDSRPLNQW